MIDPASYRAGLEAAAKVCEAPVYIQHPLKPAGVTMLHMNSSPEYAAAIRALPVPEAPVAPPMTVTREQRDELRRLFKASDEAHAAYEASNGDRNAAALADESWATLTRRTVRSLPALLDALDAAEAERDRFKAAASAYAQFAYAADSELTAAGTTRLDILAEATALERGDAP